MAQEHLVQLVQRFGAVLCVPGKGLCACRNFSLCQPQGQLQGGLRGAGTAAYILEPDAALVLEGTTAGDIPGVSPTDAACKMGGGAVISLTDMRTVYPKDYFRRAMALGKENNIPVQPKTVRAGGTDAGTIHVSRGGVKTLTISHPCRYIHSAIAMTTEKDIEAVIDLMVLMMAEISGGKL